MTWWSVARGGRTLTVSLPTDFKSVASADSAIAPTRYSIYSTLKRWSNQEILLGSLRVAVILVHGLRGYFDGDS